MYKLGEYPIVAKFPFNVGAFSVTFYGTQENGDAYIKLYRSDGTTISEHILQNVNRGPYGFYVPDGDIAGFSVQYISEVGGLAIYSIRFGEASISYPPVDGNYTISINGSPYHTYYIDGYGYWCDTFNYVKVVFKTTGELEVYENGNLKTPSPDENQWIYWDDTPSTKPLNPALTSQYEVNASIFGPDTGSPPTVQPFPYNYYYSIGFYTIAAMLTLPGQMESSNTSAGGDDFDTWHTIDSDRTFYLYDPAPAYGNNHPMYIGFTVREIANTSNNDFTYLNYLFRNS